MRRGKLLYAIFFLTLIFCTACSSNPEQKEEVTATVVYPTYAVEPTVSPTPAFTPTPIPASVTEAVAVGEETEEGSSSKAETGEDSGSSSKAGTGKDSGSSSKAGTGKDSGSGSKAGTGKDSGSSPEVRDGDGLDDEDWDDEDWDDEDWDDEDWDDEDWDDEDWDDEDWDEDCDDEDWDEDCDDEDWDDYEGNEAIVSDEDYIRKYDENGILFVYEPYEEEWYEEEGILWIEIFTSDAELLPVKINIYDENGAAIAGDFGRFIKEASYSSLYEIDQKHKKIWIELTGAEPDMTGELVNAMQFTISLQPYVLNIEEKTIKTEAFRDTCITQKASGEWCYKIPISWEEFVK